MDGDTVMNRVQYPTYIRTINMIEELKMAVKKAEDLIQYLSAFAEELPYAVSAYESYHETLQVEAEETEDDATFLYYIANEYRDLVKIGISFNPERRIKEMQTATGDALELLHTIKFNSRREALDAEGFLHRQFSNYQRQPLKVNRSSEWFQYNIVNQLKRDYWDAEQIIKARDDHWRKMKEAVESIKFF